MDTQTVVYCRCFDVRLCAFKHAADKGGIIHKSAAGTNVVRCGFLPERLAKQHVRAGRLVLLRVETPHPPSQSTLAWRAGENGRALKWWIEQLTRPRLAQGLFF